MEKTTEELLVDAYLEMTASIENFGEALATVKGKPYNEDYFPLLRFLADSLKNDARLRTITEASTELRQRVGQL